LCLSWAVLRDPVRVPVGLESVPCGWASPAQDYSDGRIELPRELVAHPEFTFCFRVCGRSMEGAGIFDGDLIAVDRLLEPAHGDVVLVETPDGFTVKRLLTDPPPRLVAEAPGYDPIPLSEDMRCLGVVFLCLHTVKRDGTVYDLQA
jgi:DNA polymerase V